MKVFDFPLIRKIWKKPQPDLSKNYMDPDIAAKQRELVDKQLKEMYEGRVVSHFLVLRDAFSVIGSEQRAGQTMHLLDAGCASGYYSEILKHLVPLNFRYIGSDFNSAMLLLAKKRYPESVLARMDLRKLAFQSESFDVILSGAVIVHIKEWKEAVSEMTRISKRWIVLHRTLIQERKSTEVRVERHYDVDVYRVYLEEAELITLLDTLGYELIRRLACNEGPMGPDVGNYTYLFRKRVGSIG